MLSVWTRWGRWYQPRKHLGLSLAGEPGTTLVDTRTDDVSNLKTPKKSARNINAIAAMTQISCRGQHRWGEQIVGGVYLCIYLRMHWLALLGLVLVSLILFFFYLYFWKSRTLLAGQVLIWWHHLQRLDAPPCRFITMMPLSFWLQSSLTSYPPPPRSSPPYRAVKEEHLMPQQPPQPLRLPHPPAPHPPLPSRCCFISGSRHLASVILVSAPLNSSLPPLLTPARTFARAQKCIFMSICQHSMYFCLFVNTDKKKEGCGSVKGTLSWLSFRSGGMRKGATRWCSLSSEKNKEIEKSPNTVLSVKGAEQIHEAFLL